MADRETMTSRQRVLKALNHEIPDRVPIDLGGLLTGIHKKAYADLLAHLGMEEYVETLDPIQQLARPSEQVLKRFHVDVRYVYAHNHESFEQNTCESRLQYVLKDEFGVVWSMPDDKQLYMNVSHHPLAEATIEDVKKYPFPDGSDASRFAKLREQALKMREETDFAISTGIGGSNYEICSNMRGLENWYMDMTQNPPFCEVLLDKVLEFWMDYYTGFMGQVGDIIDIVMIGDDLAGQQGPLFSPAFYRRYIKHRQKKLIQHIKSLTPAKILYHTCGNCLEYIPDLLDNGVDILNPVQISADNMAPKLLKGKFGKQLILWGGAIDAQHILGDAKPGEIREHVRRNLEIFKPGGGYVFSSTANIQFGVPVENITALFEAAYEFGFYN